MNNTKKHVYYFKKGKNLYLIDYLHQTNGNKIFNKTDTEVMLYYLDRELNQKSMKIKESLEDFIFKHNVSVRNQYLKNGKKYFDGVKNINLWYYHQ